MNCPDCNAGLQPSATKCRCGWVAFAESKGGPAAPPRQPCDSRGCGGQAFIRTRREGVMQNLCLPCYEGSRNAEAFEFCKSKGLNTVADMRAYCARTAKQMFREPSFERWASTVTQAGIDTLVRMGTKSDEHVLERFRAIGVIDEHDKLVPLDERAARREAHEAKLRAERERVEEMLRRASARIEASMASDETVKT